MLTLIVRGESKLITADQFNTMVDVAVRMIRDASDGTGITFFLGGLHTSEPTVSWLPHPSTETVDVDTAVERIADRLESGVGGLEADGDLPVWMSDTTAQHLYQATKLFGESSIDGLTLGREDHPPRMTRQTYRTLDRILHSYTDAIGSIEGMLVAATLNKGAQVRIRDRAHGGTVRCHVPREALREAAALIGEGVVVTGRLRRDHLGRPHRMSDARVEALDARRRVTVAEIAGTFTGPDSVQWLKDQRA